MPKRPRPRGGLIFIIRLFPEITIKSASVRKRWTRLLAQNLRTLGRRICERTSVVQDWDLIELRVPLEGAHLREAFIDLLGRTSGISNFSEVKSFALVDIDDIAENTFSLWRDALDGKTFCVRVKRAGNHGFTSTEVERCVGGALNQAMPTARVQLKKPDVTVHIDIKDDIYYIAAGKYEGLGGFPMGTQDSVMSLVSGGFDSTVASYQMMRRGIRTHFCFFRLGGQAHEYGVKEIAYYLWRKYSSSHRVKFVTVPFEGVVNEILEKVGPANMGVVLKRMMLRAGAQAAARGGIEAMVTGEAASQVSSQTIPNLAVIDRATDMLVLRPLIASAKTDIIHTARGIGMEALCASVPEYCGVISVKPSANVNLAALEEEEASFNFDLLDAAIRDSRVQSIDEVVAEVLNEPSTPRALRQMANLPDSAVVVDIRHPNDRERRPFILPEREILEIPFYKLSSAFSNLDGSRDYFLYCERGVMSELHALQLMEEGCDNVGVYRPDLELADV